jgi:hypothetical protein
LGKPKGRTVDRLKRPKPEKREEGQIARGGNSGSATESIGLRWYTSCPLTQPRRKINAILARLLRIHSWAIFPVVAVPFNVYAATAFANIRDLQTALPYAVKAVDVVKLGHDGNSGAEAAYSVRGQLRAYSGDLKGGDEDMSVAEDFGRKGSSPGVLKRDLQFHADLLNRLNRPEEARAKLDEAAKL